MDFFAGRSTSRVFRLAVLRKRLGAEARFARCQGREFPDPERVIVCRIISSGLQRGVIFRLLANNSQAVELLLLQALLANLGNIFGYASICLLTQEIVPTAK